MSLSSLVESGVQARLRILTHLSFKFWFYTATLETSRYYEKQFIYTQNTVLQRVSHRSTMSLKTTFNSGIATLPSGIYLLPHWGAALVRLQAHLAREVQVLFRQTFSGL